MQIQGEVTRGTRMKFPFQLHSLLTRAPELGISDIISWSPTNPMQFIIYKPEIFTARILPQVFRQTSLASFKRQLNAYGFYRESSSQNIDILIYCQGEGLFRRDNPVLCGQIRRRRPNQPTGPPTSSTDGTSMAFVEPMFLRQPAALLNLASQQMSVPRGESSKEKSITPGEERNIGSSGTNQMQLPLSLAASPQEAGPTTDGEARKPSPLGDDESPSQLAIGASLKQSGILRVDQESKNATDALLAAWDPMVEKSLDPDSDEQSVTGEK